MAAIVHHYLNILLPSMMPRNTAANPNILLANRYNRADLYSPERSIIIVSRVKEENVVNPPKRPVKRNILVFGVKLKASAKIQQKPIRKEPIILTDNVPKGKEKSIERCVNVETTNLSAVPIAPPVIKRKPCVI